MIDIEELINELPDPFHELASEVEECQDDKEHQEFLIQLYLNKLDHV